MSPSMFGDMVVDWAVEQAVMELVQSPSDPDSDTILFMEYLAEVERQMDKPPRYFEPLRSINPASDFDTWPDSILPCLLIMNMGLAEPPKRHGDGTWDAKWMLSCAIIISAPDRVATRESLHAYGAAFRLMMLQHKDLKKPDLIGGIHWADTRPAPIRATDERSLGAMQMLFTVDTPNVADEKGRAPDPPRDDPYVPVEPPEPEITEDNLTITERSIDLDDID